MCGIAGIIDLDHLPVRSEIALAMNDAISHRGPDDEGYVLIDQRTRRFRHFSGQASPSAVRSAYRVLEAGTSFPGANIVLSHRRFPIVDLSPNGHQPFFDDERSCCVVFNGEIYNYVELRESLEAAGHRFSTDSDTEVLLQAYLRWGTNCFEKFNGFWAIALFDFRTGQLIVSRDRIGKKPLYWTRAGNRIFFASEIKALLQIPEVRRSRRVNERAIHTWLAYGKKDLNFETCFEGIHTFPSASWSVVDSRFPNNARAFWKVPESRMREADISTEEAAKQLRELLQDAVRIRLRADVPVSVELSGGLDSATLAALAAQSTSERVVAYTVRFPEKQHNEEPFARSVARRHNLDYRVLDSPTENFWNHILPFTYLEEEPYHSPNLQTNQVIWAKMRSIGTKVSLNGAGGDENFAGYSGYYVPAQVQALLEGRVLNYLNNTLRYSQGRTNILGAVRPLLAIAGAALRNRSAQGQPSLSWFKGQHHAYDRPSLLTLQQALHSDMTDTLMPYWLRSGDRGYMGIPFEVRAPLLDYRVIEFSFRLPVTYLFRDGWHKWILRKAMEDILPADVVWRRRKMGFPFPFDRFYAENSAILDVIVKRCRNRYIDFGQSAAFRHDWKVLSFLLWYELFFNENIDLFQEIVSVGRNLNTSADYGYTPEFLHASMRA